MHSRPHTDAAPAHPSAMSLLSCPPPPCLLPVCLLFLDVDGVLNRLAADDDDEEEAERQSKKRKKEKKNKKEKKKHKKREEEHAREESTDSPVVTDVIVADSACAAPSDFRSPLCCVPSRDHIADIIDQMQLAASFDAQLLHHFCHLLHATTCAASPLPSTRDAAAAAAAAADADADVGVQIVLSTTWRLVPDSLRQVSQLLSRLGLVHGPVDDSASPIAASCRFRPHPLLATPDLRGWGSRIEEIIAFMQPLARSCRCSDAVCAGGRFLAVDDMDLFAGLGGLPAALETQLRARTVHLDGTRGFDAEALERAVKMIAHTQPTDAAFSDAVMHYQLPTPPE